MIDQEHPARKFGQFVHKWVTYYFRTSTFALMLEVSEATVRDLYDGMIKDLTEDQLFIIPYLLNLTSTEREKYNKLLADAQTAGDVSLADIYDAGDLDIEIKWKHNAYRTFNLSDTDKRKIAEMVLGKKKQVASPTQELLGV